MAPLVLRTRAVTEAHYPAPEFTVDGLDVIMDVFNLATLFADRPGAPVGSLNDDDLRGRLLRALGELLSQP